MGATGRDQPQVDRERHLPNWGRSKELGVQRIELAEERVGERGNQGKNEATEKPVSWSAHTQGYEGQTSFLERTTYRLSTTG